MSTVFDFNGASGSGWSQPDSNFQNPDAVPEGLRRKSLPDGREPANRNWLGTHTLLSQKTFGIDTGFYPLGSCTMKHNPRVNERIVQLPGIDRIHPLQDSSQVQGLFNLL